MLLIFKSKLVHFCIVTNQSFSFCKMFDKMKGFFNHFSLFYFPVVPVILVPCGSKSAVFGGAAEASIVTNFLHFLVTLDNFV